MTILFLANLTTQGKYSVSPAFYTILSFIFLFPILKSSVLL